ncbi:hypothetical protein EV126DRAFT_147972 [Verticillium dahliae]|nr:hypothetical protein EV126DRAFT_147972 [Verticillium dahliae]
MLIFGVLSVLPKVAAHLKMKAGTLPGNLLCSDGSRETCHSQSRRLMLLAARDRRRTGPLESSSHGKHGLME